MRLFLSITLMLLLSVVSKLGAQIPYPCPSGYAGAIFCNSACIVCKFDTVVGQTNFPLPPPLPSQPPPVFDLCSTGTPPVALEKPRWYGFVAGSTNIGFNIRNLGCVSGTDIEAAIVYSCDYPNWALSCGPIDPANPIISAFGLTIGKVYYLVVDGVSGADCRFQITVAFGSTVPPTSLPGNIEGLTEVCPGATTTYTLPPVEGAISYWWTTPPSTKIKGGIGAGNQINLPAAVGQPSTIEVEFGSTGGVICVTTSYACDTAKTVCMTVANHPLAITTLPDITLCYESLPYTWNEEPFPNVSAPGSVTLTSTPYESYLGCDSIVRQKIIAKPRKVKTLPLQRLCNDECFEINGFPYCESGSFSEMLVADDGCDSVLNFSILKVRSRAGIDKPDTITCRTPTITLRADSLTTTGNSVFYKWTDNLGATLGTTKTLNVSTAGPFYLVVNNVSGNIICSDTAVVTVPVNQTAPNADAGPDRVLTCDEPQIQLQGTGSTGSQYTYLWIALNGGNIVSGSTTLKPFVNATGTYRLRVTNETNGCTSISLAVVTAAIAPPTISATGGMISCEISTTTLGSTTNAISPTFAWSGPNGFTSALQNPTVSAAGTYIVVVTENNTGCTNSASAIVVADTDQPGAAATGGTITCVVLNVSLNGSTPTNNSAFAWSGPNGFTATVPNPSVSAPGPYLLTVTGPNGCTSTASTNVGLDNTPPGASLAVGANLNCNNAAVNIAASSNVPATGSTHLWTLPNGSEIHTGNNPVLSATAPGSYKIVITDIQNGCTSSATATVIQNPAVTATTGNVVNVTCNGQQNGSANASASGGTGVFTYAWNTSDNTAAVSNLNAGTYTVTATDGEGCSATATVTITQPTALSANASGSPQMANGMADGTATVSPAGGTPGYTYAWSNLGNTQTITGLLPGSYTVTVTDANGCSAISIATVNSYNCTISADVESEDATCFNADNGTAGVVTTSGVAPFTYAWSTNESVPFIQNLAPGTYTVLVTDAANCPETISFTISEPTAVQANATSTNMSGPATGDGTATANPTGGTSPYTYAWSNMGTAQTINDLNDGTYTVTVSDANGCTDVQTVTVLAGNCGVTTTFLTSPALCNGQANGAATVVVNGGSAPFTYKWSSGGTDQTETGLADGTYSVTVTDVNGCTVEDEVAVTEPPVLIFQVDNVVNTACTDLPDGSITVLASGGTGMLEVIWSNNQTGLTAINLVAGNYSATVTDANGCTATTQATVNAVDTEAPTVNAAGPFTAELGAAGSVTLNVQTLGLVVTDNCAVDKVTFQPGAFDCSQLGPHNVVVTATDDAGNTSTTTIVVTVEDNLAPTLTCPPSVIRCFGDDVVQYPAPVATDNCLGNGGSFDLSAGLPSGAQFPPGATTTTYTYTDADGNVGSCSFEVTILTELTVALDTILNDVGGAHVGAVMISPNGSLSPYKFEWYRNNVLLPGETSEDLDSIGNGSYTVIITDEIGCTATAGPFVVDSLVNSTTPEWSHGLLIVPNPTSGELAVIFPTQLSDDAHFAAYDMTGRLVLQQTAVSPERMDLDLSKLADGLYTVLIRVKGEVIARKIVVSKN